jgi:hypothetical protein
MPIVYSKSEPRTCDLCQMPALNLFQDPDLEIMTCQECRGHLANATLLLAHFRLRPVRHAQALTVMWIIIFPIER